MLLSYLICISCVYNHEGNSQDLGNNFYYLADASESQILLNLKPNQTSKIGKTIVPEEVLEYNFNDSYIVAKNLNHQTKTQLFWIVNKQANLVESLDSITFLKRLKELDIDLKLEPRK